MGLVEFHVDRIDVTTVPKFVLFGASEGAEGDDTPRSKTGVRDRNLPISPATILAVSIGATLLAFGVVRLKGLLEKALPRHC